MKRKKANPIDKKLIVSIVIVVALVAVAAIIFIPRSTASDSSGLPAFERSSESIRAAYLFARDNPERANGIRCYCGCMQTAHAGRIHSRGLLDCFIREDNSFDTHGANCKMCVDDLLEAKKHYAEGKSKDEIKIIQDLKHANDPKLPGMNNE
jgi:hypothetical protein